MKNIPEPALSQCHIGWTWRLAVLFILALSDPVPAQFTYTNNVGGYCDLSGYTGSGGDVEIPPSIDGYIVSTIRPFAFASNTNITSITFSPKGQVIRVYHDAFSHCSALTRLKIPDHVWFIDANGFSGCNNLTNVILGSGISMLGTEAFAYCDKLKSVYFRGNAPSNNNDAFSADFGATIYHLPSATGWPAVPNEWQYRPTAYWLPEMMNDESLGVQNGTFGFTISWVHDQTVVVDACTNIENPVWTPLETITLGFDTLYFNDLEWADYPGRFYRLRSP